MTRFPVFRERLPDHEPPRRDVVALLALTQPVFDVGAGRCSKVAAIPSLMTNGFTPPACWRCRAPSMRALSFAVRLARFGPGLRRCLGFFRDQAVLLVERHFVPGDEAEDLRLQR